MEVYVKESLHVLDYKDNVVDSIFLSDDHMTPGYAYDITVTEANTGYSDLKFNMPNMIIDDEGNKVHNPKLKLLTPLVKLRYHREVYYRGDKEITVREPQGYGDKVVYIDKTYKPTYPENVIEDHIMDYIVQPVDKKRDVLKLTTAFTAIDYPRFNLSKKKVGLAIGQDTLAEKEEWSLYENKPMDVPGTIKYQPWSNSLTQSAGGDITKVPLVWDPKEAEEYPLDEISITNLMNNTAAWPYGLLGTAFYWPIVSTARFEGTMYTEGGYLVLQLYDFYQLTKEGIDPEKHIGRYSWEWTYLTEVQKYLTPNNACNYLYHILEGTNWSVKLRDDGTPDVDIVKVDVPNPAGSETTESVDHTCNISVSNSNCYNAITTVCKGLQLYPVFDCINREVSLRVFAGKNYGLTYNLGANLTSNGVKKDGEKVITKLYVTGGKDYQGDQNINIGEATRSFWNEGDPDTEENWNPNDSRYIIKRSPYGTNYILNFKWMYDNKWITKEEILDLYSINQQINDLNKEFMIPYTEDRLRTLQEYNDAVNQYDLKQGEYQATLNSMMNKYYKTYGEYSKGTFYAFHKVPQGTHTVSGKHYVWIGYCPKCKKAWASVSKPGNCTCGNTNVTKEEIYIPLYKDFTDKWTITPPELKYPYGTGTNVSGPEYEPYLKGDFLKLVTTLDNQNNNDAWDINYYEGKVSLVTPLNPTTNPIDGYEYEIDGVKVKASSGNIDEWNRNIALYVAYYGEMLDAHEKMVYCLEKLKELDKEYDAWKAQYDGYQAEIQDKYGDYIIEGNYTNNEQPYVNLLFNEGMEASDKFAIPEVTYNLDVIDSTGLIEYRQPRATQYECADCMYTTAAPITVCPMCNSVNIIQSCDTYNDLVHRLHSVGQIVPKAGDYVTIYDEPMGLYGVPGLITEISRTLDKPVNNKIKLDTGYTDDEELVGNIITATNTVLNNADIYARTAVLKADGTIDSSSISKSLDNPNASLNIVGTNGNMLLTGSYLRFTDPSDATRAIKYSGTGVFTTSTLNEKEENVEWQKMLTPTGINATYINAGQIDTKNISIMSGLTSKVLIDQYGLVIKNDGRKAAHVTTFDSSAAQNDANYVKNWGTTNNIAGFMGVDTKNNPIVYTKGFLVAENGSNIANWITSNNGFYHLNSSNQKDLWLSPNGISGTVNGNNGTYALYANGNFGVTTGGNLYASGANISGKIVVTDTSSTVNNGTVGGFTSSDKGLTKGTIVLSPSGGAITGTVHDSGSRSDWAIYANGNFGVTTAGNLYATSAHIKGNIYADSGTFNGTVYASNGSFSGTIVTDNITATGGTIGGCSLANNKLTIPSGNVSGNFSANRISGGTLTIKNGSTTVFSVGDTSTYATAVGLNIGSRGIAMNNNSIGGCSELGVGTISASASDGVVKVNTILQVDGALKYKGYDGAYHEVAGLYQWYSQANKNDVTVEYDPGWGTGTRKMRFLNGLFVSDSAA